MRTDLRIVRLAVAGAVGVALFACHQPQLLSGVTPSTRADAYDCAFQKVKALGYRVLVEDRTTGMVMGDRAGDQHGLTHEGHVDHDLLTVAIDSVTPTSRRLRVVASSEREITFLAKTQRQAIRSSKEVLADADTVLSVCSTKATKGAP